jgi:hypothetical protein
MSLVSSLSTHLKKRPKEPTNQKNLTLLGWLVGVCVCVCSWMVGLPKFGLQDRPQTLLLMERRWSVNHESIGFSGLEKHKGTEGGMERFGEEGEKKTKKMRCD